MENLTATLELYLKGAPAGALLIAFLAGVLTSFTPCVYPLIPVTVGIIGSKSSSKKLHGLYLSLAYVLGLALVYATLGAFAALTGTLFGRVSSSSWTYLVVGNIFLLFGLSMLDVFSLQVAFFQKFSIAPERSRDGLTAFMLGGVAALVAGPCTTPVLGVLLAYVASRQNVLFGCLTLFMFALGMGLLLLIVGTFTGMLAALPRSGTWMVKIKKGFGILMIVLAEFFLIKAGQLMF